MKCYKGYDKDLKCICKQKTGQKVARHSRNVRRKKAPDRSLVPFFIADKF